MSQAPTVLHAIENGVMTISFNRPHHHNAHDEETADLFHALMYQARDDAAARVILLRGEGPSFCSGRDTTIVGKNRPGVGGPFDQLIGKLPRKFNVLDIQKPIIAAVHGHTLGGGFETAMMADIRIAADDTRMALPEIGFGIITGSAGSVSATVLAGPAKAKYLMMTGDTITAAQALAWGLVDFVCPRSELDERALAMARQIAAQPPMHLALAKQLVNGVFGDVVRDGMRREMIATLALAKSADSAEARKARAERRPPVYTGR